MKTRFINLKNTIFVRMLLTFFCIMIPIFIISISIYNWGVGTLRREISNATRDNVRYYLDNLDMDIQRIVTLRNQFATDEDLMRLASIPESLTIFERFQTTLRLQHQLIAIKNSSRYISDVRVHLPLLGKTISTFDASKDFQEEEYIELQKPESNFESQIHFSNGKGYLVLKSPSKIPGTKKLLYLMAIELSNAELERSLRQSNNYTEGGTVLYSNQQDIMLKSSMDDETAKSIKNYLVRSKKNSGGINSIKIKSKSYLMIYETSTALNMTLLKFIPESEVFAPLQKYSVYFLMFFGIAIFIMVFFSISTHKMINKPLVKLVAAFHEMEKGRMDVRIKHKGNNEFRYLYQRFNDMGEKLGVLIDQVYKQKILTQKAELKQLQSQINPHFLYNSFFALYGMVEYEDYENLSIFVKQLGSYFQFITRSASENVILKNEVMHATTYAQIQAKRFKNRIRLDFEELPVDLANLLVPRLIIQPLLENAFEHGLKDILKDGVLRMSFQKGEDCVLITVEDNGTGLEDDELVRLSRCFDNQQDESESTGLINIHKRIRYRYGEGYGLTISRSSAGGMRIDMKLGVIDEEGISSVQTTGG